RPGWKRAGIPALRRLARRLCALPLLDAAPPHDAERLQRVAHLPLARVGNRARLRPRVAQLLAVRAAARARGLAHPRAAGAGGRSALAEGALPAGQPAALQSQVL